MSDRAKDTGRDAVRSQVHRARAVLEGRLTEPWWRRLVHRIGSAPRPFVVYMLLLAAIIPTSFVIWLAVGFGAAWAVSMGGTVGTTVGTLIYVAVWDRPARQPADNAHTDGAT